MFYNDSQIMILKKRSCNFIIESSILLGLVIALFITSLFFINDNNIIAIQVSFAVSLSLATCFFIYVIINIVLTGKRRIKLINNLLNSEEITYQCQVVDIGKLRTINHNIKVYDVDILVDNKKITVHLDSEFKSSIDKLQDSVILKVRNKYIVEINK